MGGSATSFWKKNPSFSALSVDVQYMIPSNIQTYFFNITYASLNPGDAKWDQLYDLK